jgi:hypothetical protein
MKHFSTSLALAIFSLSIVSCSQDRENEGLNSNSSLPITTSSKHKARSANPLDSFNQDFSSFSPTANFQSENGWSFIKEDMQSSASIREEANKHLYILGDVIDYGQANSYLVSPEIMTPQTSKNVSFSAKHIGESAFIRVGLSSSPTNMSDFKEFDNVVLNRVNTNYKLNVPSSVTGKYLVFKIEMHNVLDVVEIDDIVYGSNINSSKSGNNITEGNPLKMTLKQYENHIVSFYAPVGLSRAKYVKIYTKYPVGNLPEGSVIYEGKPEAYLTTHQRLITSGIPKGLYLYEYYTEDGNIYQKVMSKSNDL